MHRRLIDKPIELYVNFVPVEQGLWVHTGGRGNNNAQKERGKKGVEGENVRRDDRPSCTATVATVAAGSVTNRDNPATATTIFFEVSRHRIPRCLCESSYLRGVYRGA